MVSDFSLDVREGAQAIEITPRGSIDETITLNAPKTGGRQVIIDGSELKRMNSMGVAAWMRFMAELSQQGPILLRKLSPVMITQASMISNFLGSGQVESFFTPWVCPQCDHTLEKLHKLEEAVPESLPCPKCKKDMELDSNREAYLAFRGG